MELHQYLFENRDHFNGLLFAKKLGISPSHLSRIINGKLCPSMDVAKKIEEITEGKVKWHEVMDFCYNSNAKSKC